MKNTLVVALMGILIGALVGWFVNGWRLEAKFGRAQVAAIEEYEAINKANREKWEAQTRIDQAAQIALTEQLRQSRETAQDLRDQIITADLTAPAPLIADLPECPTHEQVQIVLDNHNPFSPDFARLWNAASRGTGPGPHRTPETD